MQAHGSREVLRADADVLDERAPEMSRRDAQALRDVRDPDVLGTTRSVSVLAGTPRSWVDHPRLSSIVSQRAMPVAVLKCARVRGPEMIRSPLAPPS